MNDMYQTTQSRKHTVVEDTECQTWRRRRQGPGGQHGAFCNLEGKGEVDVAEWSGEGLGWLYQSGSVVGDARPVMDDSGSVVVASGLVVVVVFGAVVVVDYGLRMVIAELADCGMMVTGPVVGMGRPPMMKALEAAPMWWWRQWLKGFVVVA